MSLYRPGKRQEVGGHLIVEDRPSVDHDTGQDRPRYTCIRCNRKRRPYWIFTKFPICKGTQRQVARTQVA